MSSRRAALEGKSAAYILSQALRLHGILNRSALERAIYEIVTRHESLRTHFIEIEGEPTQVIVPDLAVFLPLEDLSAMDREAQQVAVATTVRRNHQEPFVLSKGPLLRARLIKLGDREHILLLAFHHIITDGWSMAVFHRELTSLYDAFREGSENPLQPLAVQYADYTLWQREWLQGGNLNRQVDYWTAKLAGAPPVLTLPRDEPRSTHPSPPGGRRTRVLPADLTRSLTALCHREGATLFMGLLAAFKVLLARLSRQDDIVIGTPIANRNRVELEALIGFFMGTLALRTDLSARPTFQELLRQVRATALEAFDNQDLPFERLIEVLRVERSLAHSPVFQIFFNMLNQEGATPALSGLEVERIPQPDGESKFDITLYAAEAGGEIHLHAVYNVALFHGETIERMLDQLHRLLDQIVANPAQSIHTYSLIRPRDVAILPDPTRPLAKREEMGMHDGFVIQAKRVPHRVALTDGVTEWTYAEVDEISNRLACRLRREGLQAGEVVAVYATRSPALVWSLLGILKAGGVFMILDSAYPARRLRRYLDLAEPVALLNLLPAEGLPDAIAEFTTPRGLRFHTDIPAEKSAALARFEPSKEDHDFLPSVAGDAPAYIVFTSGSTGDPLGILGTHAPVSHFLRWHIDRFDLRDTDRFSLLSGLGHDPLLRDIFTPLSLGASLHLPPADVGESPGALAQWLDREQISVCHTTPAMVEYLGDAEPGQELDTLRWMFIGGDRLNVATVRKIRGWSSSCGLVNFYGTTETPQAMGFHVVTVEDIAQQSPAGTIPIGREIEGAQLLLLNAADGVAAIGELAEICIRTPHLSREYLTTDDRTKDRFQSNPFHAVAEDRIFRTGDMGRYRSDGTVLLAGRKDAQVKIRGFRVELGEIEAALRTLPEVKSAGVFGRENDSGIEDLVACLVSRTEAPTPAKLRAELAKLVPDYMVPSRFVLIPDLPLTPNGKLDRKALEKLTGGELASDQTYVAPQNEREEALEEIWQTLLRRERVGIHDNFFDLGGHSLLATQVISRMRGKFDVEIPLRALFESPTIAALGTLLEEMVTASERAEDVEHLLRELESLTEDDAATRLIADGDGATKAPGTPASSR